MVIGILTWVPVKPVADPTAIVPACDATDTPIASITIKIKRKYLEVIF
jgi:hypothetical protein